MEPINKFKIARQALGKNQKEMASLVGVAYRSWQVYEQGTSVPGGNVLKALAELGFNVNWFFDDDETPMFTEPRDKAAHIDMVKEIALNDKEATARRMQKMETVGTFLQKARERAMSYRDEIKEAPVDAQIEALIAKLESEIFSRIAAEDSLNKEALSVDMACTPSDNHSLGENVELLAKIHHSGDNTLIRAISANLNAFSDAIDNKTLALNTMKKMEDMEGRMMAMEKEIAEMKDTAEQEKKLQAAG
jgi:transcriptional regulator with XRE-family HTH domain